MAAGRMVKVYTARKRKAVPKVRMVMPRTTKSLVKLIKNVSLKTTETKTAYLQAENVALYHNVECILLNLCTTSAGTTQHTRIGDQVVARYLNIKLWLSQKSDRSNVMFRIVLYSVPLSNTSATLTYSAGASGNKMIGTFDTDRVQIIKQKILKPLAGDYSEESGAALKEHSRLFSFRLNLKNRKINYGADAGTTPSLQKNFIHCAIIPYDAYGTQTTDNIESFAYQTSFYFKDP